MALDLKFTISQDFVNGTDIIFTDTTGDYDATTNTGGYGTPNATRASILATRFIMSDYVRERDASTSVSETTAYKEYKPTDGDLTYDSKVIVEDTTFIPVAVDTLDGTVTVAETGRFQIPSTFIPVDTTATFSLTECDFADLEHFPDRVYSITYEVYKTVTATGDMTMDFQYIVLGDEGETVTFDGNTYKPGEVFIASEEPEFTVTGTPSVVALEATVTKHFILSYNSHKYIQKLRALLAQQTSPKKREELQRQISKLVLDFNGLMLNASQFLLNISAANSLLDHIEQEYNRLIRDYA